MSTHAKAASASSTERSNGKRRLGGLLAILALALCVLGSGAPAALAAPPIVTIDPASQVGVTSAKASGEVNPKGKEASYRFEYVSDANFQAQDTEQKLIVVASAGTYTLSFQGETTAPIAFDVSAGTVQGELEALSTIGAGNVAVSGGPGDEKGLTPYFLSFGGPFSETNVDPLGVTSIDLVDDPQYGPYIAAETILPGHPEGFALATQAGFGNTPVEPEAILEGLQPGTEYHLRLVAENADSEGTPSVAVAPNFTTGPLVVPTVAIDPPSEVKYTTAHLTGQIDPEGGNLNPASGGPVPIGWELQLTRDPVGEGWPGVLGGAIEGADAESSSPVAVPVDLTGLQNGATYKFRFKAYYAGGHEETSPEGEFQLLTVAKPTATIDPVSAVTGTSAHIAGHVAPNAPGAAPQDPAFDTTWSFSCTPECPGISGQTIPADDQSHEVFVDAAGLKPGTHYEVTLTASSLGGEETAGPVSFDTPVLAPVVQSGSATVTATSAGVSGSIDPRGGETSYHFDYGTSGLGQSTPVQVLPAGNETASVTANLTGLTPGTTYHYQLVATNSAGEAKGAERSFTTAAASGGESCPNAAVRAQQGSTYLPECRAYEIVNNPGLDVGDVNRVAHISDDGEHVATMSVVPGDESIGAGVSALSISHRTPSGWTQESADPASRGSLPQLAGSLGFKTFSSDYKSVLTSTPFSIDPADTNNANDLYRIDVGKGSGTWMSFAAGALEPEIFAALPDLSRVLFKAFGDATHPSGLYASDGKELELISILPDGEPAGPSQAVPAGAAYLRGFPETSAKTQVPWVERGGNHGASDDLRRIYFYSTVNSGGGLLYVRDLTGDEPQTYPVSASLRSGDLGTVYGSYFISGAHDGSTAYFQSAAQLVDGAPPGGGIYRFNLASKTLDLLTPDPHNAAGLEVFGAFASDDQSHIYFTSPRALVNGAVAGRTNAYVWTEADGTRFIAAVNDGDRFERVTPDGRYALILSNASVDGAPNNGQRALYEYDYASGDMACVSCRPDGSPSQGGASIAMDSAGFPGEITHGRGLAFDGRVFFNSSDRLVPRDSTSASDVYGYNRGALSLLSSGNDNSSSFVGDNSDDGNHVFIVTRAALLDADRDKEEYDVYDVHVNGGFLEPPPPAAPCEGEACRASSSPPVGDANDATSAFVGPPNRRRCAKGKVRRNGRCVKPRKKRAANKQGSRKRNANTNGRTGR